MHITWTLLRQAGYGARDTTLVDVADRCLPQTAEQLAWLTMTMKAEAPQTLLVAQ